jgi:hypothetical protein
MGPPVQGQPAEVNVVMAMTFRKSDRLVSRRAVDCVEN